MADIKWDTGTKTIRQGIDKVAFFTKDAIGTRNSKSIYGAAWDGVTAVNESPSGAEPTKLYADNRVYNTLYSIEEFAATVEAYQVPEAFDKCDGIRKVGNKSKLKLLHQERDPFVLVYHENVYDTDGKEKGFGIYHIVTNCKAAPSAKDHATINDSPEAATLSYELSTTPVSFEIGGKTYNSAHVTIDATDTAFWNTNITNTGTVDLLESVLYNDETNVMGNIATYILAVLAKCQSAT